MSTSSYKCFVVIYVHVVVFLQLSEVSLRSQTSPFPAKDLPLGPCDCGTTSDSYESELSTLRGELETRLTDLQALRGQLTALQEEHDETLEELGRSRKHLDVTQRERNQLESQVCLVCYGYCSGCLSCVIG